VGKAKSKRKQERRRREDKEDMSTFMRIIELL
jgi:hypothetical protein